MKTSHFTIFKYILIFFLKSLTARIFLCQELKEARIGDIHHRALYTDLNFSKALDNAT